VGELIVPRNFGREPGIILFNFRVAKTFAFGRFRERGQVSGGSGEFFRRVPTGPFQLTGADKMAEDAQTPLHSLPLDVRPEHPQPQQSRGQSSAISPRPVSARQTNPMESVT
jgi:hypothetical protein